MGGWARLPPALRVGLALGFASALAGFYTAARLRDVGDTDTRIIAGLIDALGVGGELVGLLGAIAWTRVEPRARVLVGAYAASLAEIPIAVGLETWLLHAHAYDGWVSHLLPYLWWATAMTLVIAWAILATSGGWIVTVVATGIGAALPPPGQHLYAWFGHDSERGEALFRAVIALIAHVAVIGVACARGATSPPPRPTPARGGFGGLAFAALAMAISELWRLDVAVTAPLRALAIEAAAVAALVWASVAAVRARAPGDAGHWALLIAASAWGAVAAARVWALVGWGLAVLDVDSHMDMSDVPLAGELVLGAGAIAAVVALHRIAARRGAAAFEALAIGLVVAIALALGGGVLMALDLSPASWTPVDVAGAIAFAVVAVAAWAARRALGEGADLPTATLRAK